MASIASQPAKANLLLHISLFLLLLLLESIKRDLPAAARVARAAILLHSAACIDGPAV